VKQDHAQAVAWYRKAAEQGEAMAQNNLGVMYENGQGVKKDRAQALGWYRKAAAQGNDRARNNLAELEQEQPVVKSAEGIELFGTTLRNAQRTQMRQVLKQNGMTATRELDQYWYDQYDARGVLKEATEFSVGYVGGRFGEAMYTFPSHLDTDQVRRIIEMVSVKYGKPTTVNGRYNRGTVTATWKMKQGMEVIVQRGWPSTTTNLILRDTAAHRALNAEIAANEKAQTTAQAKAQGRAF